MGESVRVYNAAGLGAAVRYFREDSGMTQQQLAEQVAVNGRYITTLESDHRSISWVAMTRSRVEVKVARDACSR